MLFDETTMAELLESLKPASFYEDFGDVFSLYGQKRRWLGRTNRQRISNQLIDGEAIKMVLQRLERYDASRGWLRFFQRVFTSIEKQRSLLCYWAVEYLRANATGTADAEVVRQVGAESSSLPGEVSASDRQAQAIMVLRLHASHLTSSVLRQPLKRWSLTLALGLPSLWQVWSYLKSIWNPRRAAMETDAMNQQDTTVMHTLGILLETTLADLRQTYLEPVLDEKSRSLTKQKILSVLEKGYARVVEQSMKSEKTKKALKEVYQLGLEKIELEEGYYAKRIVNSKKHLEVMGTSFKEKPELSLIEQWNKQHQADIQARFEMAKGLLRQAFPTRYYGEVKQNVRSWLNGYLYAFFKYYLNGFMVCHKAEGSLLEDRQAYQVAHERLYKQICACLETGLKEMFMHEADVLRVQTKLQCTDLKSWLGEWLNLISPAFTVSLVEGPRAAEIVKDLFNDNKVNRDAIPTTLRAWQKRFEEDLGRFVQQKSCLEKEISKAVQASRQEEAQRILDGGLKTIEKMYRMLSRVYHPDRLQVAIVEGDSEEKKRFSHEKFVLLKKQKDEAIELLKCSINQEQGFQGPLSAWEQWFRGELAKMDEKLHRMDEQLAEIFASYREIRADLQALIAEQRCIAEFFRCIAEEQKVFARMIADIAVRLEQVRESTGLLKQRIEQQGKAFEHRMQQLDQDHEQFMQQLDQDHEQFMQQLDQDHEQFMKKLGQDRERHMQQLREKDEQFMQQHEVSRQRFQQNFDAQIAQVEVIIAKRGVSLQTKNSFFQPEAPVEVVTSVTDRSEAMNETPQSNISSFKNG